MARPRKPSVQTLRVLEALARAGGEWRYGLELAEATKLKSGTLYPILMRLEERGLVEARWLEPTAPGRPPRHGYRILAAGRELIHASGATPEPKRAVIA